MSDIDAARSQGVGDGTGAGASELNDPNSPLSVRVIYFDYDSVAIKPEFQGQIEGHARFLRTNASRRIAIEGHTDERGGREYNLALGQRRAEAVRRALSLLGVPDTQVEAVSFGKEKPAATGADESTWSKNRRAEIHYR
jgi:peptidoglycan-associated lipoprotein